MNTQTQEAGYLFDFSKFLFDEHGLIVTDTEMQEIIHQAKKVATQPIAADAEELAYQHYPEDIPMESPSDRCKNYYLREAFLKGYANNASQQKSAGVWVKASERMPELYPINNSHEFHYRLDGYKVDGFFLHSQCFEYFNPEIAGYTQLELTEFNRIEWLDEYASQPKGAGVPPDWQKIEDDISDLLFEANGTTSGARDIIEYLAKFSSLPSQEGNTN